MNKRKHDKSIAKNNNYSIISNECGSAEERPFKKRCEGFTKKLKGLMRENKALPVVVAPQMITNDTNLECAIAYVYCKESGRFVEKIIVIYGSGKEEFKMQDYEGIIIPF